MVLKLKIEHDPFLDLKKHLSFIETLISSMHSKKFFIIRTNLKGILLGSVITSLETAL